MNSIYRWRFYLFCTLSLFFSLGYCIEQPIEGIDKIYLINLDHRPDRLASSQRALAQYGITPCRFPAVNGRKLSLETLINIALPCTPEICQQRWMTTPLKDGTLGYTLLNKTAPLQPVFWEWTSIGAVGCALSHFSVLREAYDKGYETIWVMEDDILVQKDPHLLTELIKKLDLISDGKWDLLYTDSDNRALKSHISKLYWWMWRPDLAPAGDIRFSHQEIIDTDFVRIGSRVRTHSMIIRRSGMKKILDHFENNHLFLPIDHELAFAKEIILYMLSYPIITYDPKQDTDIQKPEPFISLQRGSQWEEYKKMVLKNSTFFPGWCSTEKGECLMDFIYCHKPALCVEIGAFGGSTSYPIASSLKFLNQGHLYAIDAWSQEEALRGFSADDPNYAWWANVDLDDIKKKFTQQLVNENLSPWSTIIQNSSRKAAEGFTDNSIDLLYVDGNFSASGSLEDLISYFPKVKPGGYIWLNDAHSPTKHSSIAYMMELATFIPQESLRNWCVVFQKASLD